MTDHDTIERLRTAMAVETRGHHLDPGAAATALTGSARRRPPLLAIAASLVAVLVVAGGAWWLDSRNDSTPAAKPSCALDMGPLPTWARDSFSPDAIDAPHAIGTRSSIVAIPFIHLRAKQPAGTFNKIVWVPRDGGSSPLRIRATLDGRTVTRSVHLGPSYLDLPSAGCWDLQLSWDGGHDRLALAYAP